MFLVRLVWWLFLGFEKLCHCWWPWSIQKRTNGGAKRHQLRNSFDQGWDGRFLVGDCKNSWSNRQYRLETYEKGRDDGSVVSSRVQGASWRVWELNESRLETVEAKADRPSLEVRACNVVGEYADEDELEAEGRDSWESNWESNVSRKFSEAVKLINHEGQSRWYWQIESWPLWNAGERCVKNSWKSGVRW